MGSGYRKAKRKKMGKLRMCLMASLVVATAACESPQDEIHEVQADAIESPASGPASGEKNAGAAPASASASAPPPEIPTCPGDPRCGD